ncbi:MAG: branched-chain amino acid ABC transporter permease, partial [Chloroflexota bacterium]
GVGTLWGPTLGALVLIPLSETTRVYLGGGGRAVDLLVYGMLIMLVATFQPRGLIGLFTRLLAPGSRQPALPPPAAKAELQAEA